MKRGSWKVIERTLSGFAAFGGEVNLVTGSTAADRETYRETDRRAGRQTRRQTDEHTARQAHRHTYKQANRKTQTERHSQPERRTGRQADRQTEPGLDSPPPAATCSWLRRVSAML